MWLDGYMLNGNFTLMDGMDELYIIFLYIHLFFFSNIKKSLVNRPYCPFIYVSIVIYEKNILNVLIFSFYENFGSLTHCHKSHFISIIAQKERYKNSCSALLVLLLKPSAVVGSPK